MPVKLTEEIIKEYSYTEGTRALLNSDFEIQDLSDLLYCRTAYRNSDFIKHDVKYNIELNMYYIVKIYTQIKSRFNHSDISICNILGFELYATHSLVWGLVFTASLVFNIYATIIEKRRILAIFVTLFVFLLFILQELFSYFYF